MTPSSSVTVQTPMQLSTHLRSLRKARGLTQAELGLRIGVKQVRIAEIEKDPGAISVQQLMRILHALDARLVLADVSVPPVPRAAEPRPQW
jgi:HTH-type transcriptional regulator/antitoxin HipB